MDELADSRERREHIDVVRAAICCLSYESPSSAIPVHSNQVAGFFRRYFPGQSVQDALASLQNLREAVSLSKGYWLPAPARVVPLHGVFLLIAPNPTQELQRSISPKVSYAGLARICYDDVLVKLPVQELDDWMAIPKDLDRWTRESLTQARATMSPTVSQGRAVDVYSPWDAITRGRGSGKWFRNADASNISPHYPALCIEKSVLGQVRWFFAEIRHGVITHESSTPPIEPARLRFGIDRLAGYKNQFRAREAQGAVILTMPSNLPQPEQTLLSALALRRNVGRGANEFLVPEPCFPAIKGVLEKLSFRGEKSQ